MYARVIRIGGSPSKVDEGVDAFIDQAAPRAKAQDGYSGIRLLINRNSGQAMVVGFWRDQAALDASREGLRSLRDSQATIWGSGPPEIEEFEAAVQHRPKSTDKGNWARLTTLQGDPAKIDEGIKHFESVTIPGIEKLSGFRAAILFVNHENGRALVATVWDSKSELDSSAEAATPVRSAAAEVLGAGQPLVESFEVAYAELLTPVTS
jgi:heme-degrading monooxygenase HmoA